MIPLRPYLKATTDLKARLFDLYRDQGAQLERKVSPRSGGTTWGYQLAAWAGYNAVGKMTGTSIGDDEIRVFFDLCGLVSPKVAYIVGNGFGLSTFCLALAEPACQVVAIDNWSEGEAGEAARRLSLEIASHLPTKNAHIATGTSPIDIPRTLEAALGRRSVVVDLAFIDGRHTDEAAHADFDGLCPYLDAHSIVLWHNVYATRRAFCEVAESPAGSVWDSHLVLRTYGPLGLSFDSRAHPLLVDYLGLFNLVWTDWEKYLQAFMAAGSSSKAQPPEAIFGAHFIRRMGRRVLRRIGIGRVASREEE